MKQAHSWQYEGVHDLPVPVILLVGYGVIFHLAELMLNAMKFDWVIEFWSLPVFYDWHVCDLFSLIHWLLIGYMGVCVYSAGGP